MGIALLAAIVSYAAWKRPLPADPTKIPTFGGENGSYRDIDDGLNGERFFQFLDANPGRKIRIAVRIVDPSVKVEQDPSNPKQGHSVSIPCKPALWEDGGMWTLEGYFANYGTSVGRNN